MVKKVKAFLLASGRRQVCPHSVFLVNEVLGVLDRAFRQYKELKGIEIGSGVEKSVLFAKDMILYI